MQFDQGGCVSASASPGGTNQERDRVALIGGHQWQYGDATVPEYAKFAGQSVQYVFNRAPRGRLHSYRIGGRADRQMAPTAFWADAPRFGDWRGFITDGPGLALSELPGTGFHLEYELRMSSSKLSELAKRVQANRRG